MKTIRSFGFFSIGLGMLGLGLQQASSFVFDMLHVPMILAAALMWLIGIVCSIIGMVKSESLRWLPAIGFGLNLILLVSGFIQN